jgi:hypothetical protein
MQPAIGIKRYVVTHVGASSLVVAILCGGVVGMAGLAATENLPWQSDGAARNASPPTVRVAQPRQQGGDVQYTLASPALRASQPWLQVSAAEQAQREGAPGHTNVQHTLLNEQIFIRDR